jgi:hypothetical protein
VKIVSSKSQKHPLRIALYGLEGIGKSSWAAGAPKPLFFDLERGMGQLVGLDVPVTMPASFKEFLDGINNFPANEYKTAVIDSADALEDLIARGICAEKGWDSIEDPGYGKGYSMVTERFVHALEAMDKLIEKGVQIIVTAHSLVRNFQNPAGADYSRYELTLFKGSSQPGPGPILKGWCDALLFACYSDTAKLEKRDQGSSEEVLKKGKGITGQRVIKTRHEAAWDAKNRLGLPPELPLNYADFAKAIGAAGQAGSVTQPDQSKPAVAAAVSPNGGCTSVPGSVAVTTPAVVTIKEVSAALTEYMVRTQTTNPATAGAFFAQPLGYPSVSKMPKDAYPTLLAAIREELEALPR